MKTITCKTFLSHFYCKNCPFSIYFTYYITREKRCAVKSTHISIILRVCTIYKYTLQNISEIPNLEFNGSNQKFHLSFKTCLFCLNKDAICLRANVVFNMYVCFVKSLFFSLKSNLTLVCDISALYKAYLSEWDTWHVTRMKEKKFSLKKAL